MQDTAVDKNRISDLIKAAREREGLNQQDAAAKAGMKYRTYGAYERGEIDNPAMEKVQAIASALHIEELKPAGGDSAQNKPVPRGTALPVRPEEDEGYTEVRVYDVDASAGTSAARFQDRVSFTFWVHQWMLKNVLGISVRGPIGVVSVRGDCMLPDLEDGDVCFFRYSEELEGDGRRQVLLLNEEPQVKRVHKMLDKSILVTCDNPDSSFKEQLLVPNPDGTLIHDRTDRPVDLRVVGPVVWPRNTATRSAMQEVKRMLQEAYRQAPA